MDRLKQKLKKEKHVKDCGKDKYPLFITDVKSIKENLKIKEILRNVKMNSSMRLKGPPGSKIMCNKDFTEEDCFEETPTNENETEALSAINPDVNIANTDTIKHLEKGTNAECENKNTTECESGIELSTSEENDIKQSDEQAEQNISETKKLFSKNSKEDVNSDKIDNFIITLSNGKHTEKNRDRKLSLDHTMLSRQDGFSQSELDLHTIGKSPLERKYSFFRKKMDSFVRNTTEMFRRQNSSLQRRVSMSVSLQSLNDKSSTGDAGTPTYPQEPLGSRTSLHTPPPIARSTSSLSLVQSGTIPSSPSQTSLGSSQPTLHAFSSPTLEDIHSNSNSVHSLNEGYLKEAMLNSRAISMSSGLDAPFGQQRRKASRSNRVTWIASEGLTNYLRRKIQDEKSREMQTCHSYQDFSCIPENELYSQKPNVKGRRLSYQRAVSGEDPMPIPVKFQDSLSKRRHQIPEYIEANFELANCLEEFTTHGVPLLHGFDVEPLPEEDFAYLLWATKQANIEEFFDWKTLPPKEEARQAVIRELIYTEADYIKHLMAIVEVFIAAAHTIQYQGKMLNIETTKLFSNLPDILNASLAFWHVTFMPMITEAVENSQPFNTNLMSFGFSCSKEIFVPYEKFVIEQSKLLDYYRKKQQSDPEFAMYLKWCHSQKQCNRLQLNDFLVKPMQRMTKYNLILKRIVDYTENESDRLFVESMEMFSKGNVVNLNRSVRQREEQDKLDALANIIENFEVDIKDEEAEKMCKSFAKLNLKAPMLYCLPIHSRHVIHQGELRFRDAAKEIEVRVMLLTDMILVCRKLPRGIGYQFKLIRPKYMLDKMVQIPRVVSKNNKDLSGLLYVLVDDLGSVHTSFILSEMPKDPNPQQTLKTWENKFKEAKLTYELATIIAHNPNKDLSKADVKNVAEYTNTKSRYAHEEGSIEHEAHERAATMAHRSMGALNNDDFLLKSLNIQPFDVATYAPSTHIVLGASARLSGRNRKCCIVHRTSNVQPAFTPRESKPANTQGAPRARSPDKPKPGPSGLVKRIDTSPDRLLPPAPDADGGLTITVRVTESESEVSKTQRPASPLQTTPSQSSDGTATTQSTLSAHPQDNVATLIHSLPDVTIEPCTPRSTSSPTQPTASEKMYQAHFELLQRNRLITTQTQQYLTPDTRGSSYPPPSPTRASLKRGLAFSYSFKYPPLSKMGHVGSQSQLDTMQYSPQEERGGSPKPGTSSEKSEKKSKLTSSRGSDKKSESEDRQSDRSLSRKGESPGPSYRGESPDPYRRGESSCSSYRDESPASTYKHGSTDFSFRDKSTSPSPGTSEKDEISAGPSYKEISPYSSIHDESPGPTQREESIDRSSVEVSSGPAERTKTADLKARFAARKRKPDIQVQDVEHSDRESKSSDSFLKQQSLSFSIKDESYDSSRSHKDETSFSEHKEYSFSASYEDKSFKDRLPEISLQEDKIIEEPVPGISYEYESSSTHSSSMQGHEEFGHTRDDESSSSLSEKRS